MADKVTIELEVLAKRALDSVEKFSKNAQGQLDSISFNSTVSAINAGMELISKVAKPVFDILEAGFNKATTEALEAEASAISLANALRISGEFSQEAVEGFNDLAASIQKTTTQTDDAVISAVALAKTYGLSNIEARNAIKVAVDLSARLGIDLGSATEKVAKTMRGFVDKDLAQMVGGLKGLTLEQKIAGEGLLLIQKNVEGSAEALTNSFGGALKQLKNNFNEVFEQFGTAVISTPEFSKAINSLATQFGLLAVEVARLAPDIALITGQFISFGAEVLLVALKIEKFTVQFFASIRAGFNALVQGIGGLLEAIPAFFDFLILSTQRGALKFQAIFQRLNPVNIFKSAKDAGEKAGKAFDPLINSGQRIKDAISGADKAVQSLNKTLEKDDGKAAAKRLSDNIGDRAGQIEQQLTGVRSTLNGIVQKSIDDVTKAPLFGLIQFAVNGQQELDKVKLKIDEAVREIVNNKDIPEAYKNQAKAAAQAAKDAVDGSAGKSLAIGFTNSISSALTKGAAGASEAAIAIAGGITEVLLPGFGAAAQSILTLLSQGPEKVRETVEGFVRAIPAIIDNVIKSFPVLIETLARELPPVISKIAPVLAQRFAIELVKNMPTIIKGFADGLVEAAKQFVQAIFDNIKSVGGLLSTSGGGGAGNGKGGVVVRAAKAVATFGLSELIGFAEGGRIPDLPQFAGDRFPAKLSAGEQILSRDLSSKLDAFLSGSQGTTPTVVQITIGQREMARVLLDLNRGGFRTA